MEDASKYIENFLAAVDFQDPVDVSVATALTDLPEWDSLAALGVIVMFDMEYGVTITGEDLKNCSTVGDIHGLIAKKRG